MDQAEERVSTIRGAVLAGLIDSDVRDQHEHAAAKAEQAEAARDRETLAIAFAKAERNNDLSKLSRYEVAIERSLYRALHELERLQARRQGGAVPAPVLVDVEVSTPPT